VLALLAEAERLKSGRAADHRLDHACRHLFHRTEIAMNETPKTNDTANMERRRGAPVTMWGELVVESSWRPQDKPRVESEGWLRANGYLADRRAQR
jgi:hypothetical protein